MLMKHVSIPFDRLAGELNLPLRGIIPPGAFVTGRTSPSPGWDKPGLPVPELTSRRARQLYNRGFIVPVPATTPAVAAPESIEHPLGFKPAESKAPKGKGKF